jgi:two-component system nitrogen regulation sensor histidine kinase GlnL
MSERSFEGFEVFDHLATLVAVVRADGRCRWVNATLENAIGSSRRSLLRSNVRDWLVDPAPLVDALRLVSANEVACGRFDALLERQPVGTTELAVHVIVSQMDRRRRGAGRDDRDRAADPARPRGAHAGQAQANKELVRNLAHEIKNPLGGIRGAAQLLAMEVDSRELTEYTQVIIHEADRLQALVDRLLAPHRRAHGGGDVNIHEVCERVRSLVLAEFPRGLTLERDYDVSIPEFRGDREQLIQAVLNIAQNATQALASPKTHAARRPMRGVTLASCCAPGWRAR